MKNNDTQKPNRPAGYRQPSRTRTAMIAGHFNKSVQLALHELLGRVSVKKGEKVTVQNALSEALELYFRKHGAKPPADLIP